VSHTDEDRWFRMVTAYWEMVATMVNRGTLHAELFYDHTGEDIVSWERIKGLIPDARADLRPTYLCQLEKLVAGHQAYRRRTNAAALAKPGARAAASSKKMGKR